MPVPADGAAMVDTAVRPPTDALITELKCFPQLTSEALSALKHRHQRQEQKDESRMRKKANGTGEGQRRHDGGEDEDMRCTPAVMMVMMAPEPPGHISAISVRSP